MAGGTQTLNEIDFESPGYEFLRSYQSMSLLYDKLVVLNYQKDFCSTYKCPLIHQYYFSMPSKNQSEQSFLFTCLCAWLIKDRCHMNFEINPEEYQDLDSTVDIIFEALTLLHNPSESDSRNHLVNFPVGRLKQGFGPEVIYTLNIFADRALELLSESEANNSHIHFIFHNKGQSEQRRQSNVNYITIGQPFVGGGLTTRPLGSYQIDDASLILDDGDEDKGDLNQDDRNASSLMDTQLNEADWYQCIDRIASSLESVGTHDGVGTLDDWRDHLEATRSSQKTIEEFLNQSSSLLKLLAGRIERQLHVIYGREKFLQTNLKKQIDDFLNVWRDYSQQTVRNKDLMEQVNSRADLFERHHTTLNQINANIESQIEDLNDGRELAKLRASTEALSSDNQELNLRIGLLLATYAKKLPRLASK